MRYIKTTFFNRHGEVIKVNSSTDANVAVATAILHLQINRYGAKSVQVHDDESGELHADIVLWLDGSIKINYKRDPSKYERRLSLQAFKDVK